MHCYRMLASFDDAEDAVQETLLRAWRGRDWYDGGRTSAPGSTGSRRTSAWTCPAGTPGGGAILARSAGCSHTRTGCWTRSPRTPTSRTRWRSTGRRSSWPSWSALQLLPPRQRAALIARDVLGWPASDTAAMLETSVAAANSALQRARTTMQQHLPARRTDWRPTADRRGTGAARSLHRRARTLRRGRGDRDRRRRHPRLDAAGRVDFDGLAQSAP